MNEYFDTQKWFDDMLAQDGAEHIAKKKLARLEFPTFRDATIYLRRTYGSDWSDKRDLCDIKVADMNVFVSCGLRVDPVTDEQYALVKKVSSRSKSAWNLRLS